MKKHRPGPKEIAEIRRKRIVLFAAAFLFLGCVGFGIWATYNAVIKAPNISAKDQQTSEIVLTSAENIAILTTSPNQAASSSISQEAAPTSAPMESQLDTSLTPAAESSAVTTEAVTETETEANLPSYDGDGPDLSGYVVVLDPGHQTHANSEQESIGPGMSGTKDKCSSGTQGVSTGRAEYEVNLEISLKLCDYLQSLGCEVYLTRTQNDVNISNIDRADIALSYSPDVYLRLHCDGSDDSSSRGVGVFVADTGTYASSLGGWGDILGESVASSTGANYRGCNAGSTYSGLNWAADIPSFLLEMGFMSNASDDELLSDSSYQQKICEGIAVFISKMPQT